jgi:hypothetical protein
MTRSIFNRFLLCALLLLLATPLWAQFTLVSGTITDPNGLPYAGGLIAPTLVSSGTPKFTATNQPYTPPTQATGLSPAGSFQVQLADVTQLSPGGSTWSFTVTCGTGCVQPSGGKGSVSFTITGITISGATQNISAQLQAAAPTLSTGGGGGGGTFPTAGNASFSAGSVTITALLGFFNPAFVTGQTISVAGCSAGGDNSPPTFTISGVTGSPGAVTAITYVDASGATATGCVASLIQGSATPPFNNISAGTNPNALLISGSLAPTGGGTIGANILSGLASAAFIATNGAGTPIAAPCTSTQILVGNASNLGVCQALTGDSSITNAGVMKNVGLNGVLLSSLLTGPLCNTTTTGVPFICLAGNFPTLNQSTSGTAANLSGAPLLPGGTTAVTQATSDNSQDLATDQFVKNQGYGAVAGGIQGLAAGYGSTAQAVAPTFSFGVDASVTTGLVNNDFCDKAGQTFTNLNATQAGIGALVREYTTLTTFQQHCTWATFNAMLANCNAGVLDIGYTWIYVDVVAGAPGLSIPAGCRMIGLGRRGTTFNTTGITGSILACKNTNAPIAGCHAPTFCTANATPVAGCTATAGGAGGGVNNLGSNARAFAIDHTVVSGNYLEICFTSTCTAGTATFNPEDLVQIQQSTNPTNDAMFVACSASLGSYPGCPASPTNGAIYVANWTSATACASSCGFAVGGTPLVKLGTAATQFGCGLEDLNFSLNGTPGLIAVQNNFCQELSEVHNIMSQDGAFADFDIYSSADQNSGEYQNLNSSTSLRPTLSGVQQPCQPGHIFARYVGQALKGFLNFSAVSNGGGGGCDLVAGAAPFGSVITALSGTGTVITVTYTQVIASPQGAFPIVHGRVDIAGVTTTTAYNGTYYVCGPQDNPSCINPTATSPFQFTVLGSASGTAGLSGGTCTVGGTVACAWTYQHVAIFADGGPASVENGHSEGYDTTVCIGCNAAAQGVQISNIGFSSPAGPALTHVDINSVFATTSPRTSDFLIRNIDLSSGTSSGVFGGTGTWAGALYDYWDHINNPGVPIADSYTQFYGVDYTASVNATGVVSTSPLILNRSPANMPFMLSASGALSSLTNLTGLAFLAEPNQTYTLVCTLYYQVSAATANLSIAITGPAGVTGVTYGLLDPNTATTLGGALVATAFGSALSGSGTSTATTNFPATITMGLQNGANVGTVQVQAGAAGTGTATVAANSFCHVN